MMGYILCCLLYKSPFNNYSFPVPKWLYVATFAILPLLSFVQTFLLFKVYLYVQGLKESRIKYMLLPFTITFMPTWLVLSPYTMTWALLCKWDRITPNTAVATYLSILEASLEGLTLLAPMIIFAACVALYATFVWHAFKNVFGEYLPGSGKIDSVIHL